MDLILCLECFDVQSWVEVSARIGPGNAAGEADDEATRLVKMAKRIMKALKVADIECGLREFGRAVNSLMTRHTPAMDNRQAWCYVLTADYSSELEEPLAVLPQVVRFYLSIEDGSCDLERSLGALANVVDKHSGPLQADGITMWSLLEMAVDGPATESDVFSLSAGVAALSSSDPFGPLLVGSGIPAPPDPGLMKFTDFSRACAQLW